MSAERYASVIAAITSRPISEVRQRLRAARESGFLPSGRAVDLYAKHLARILIALACDRVADVGPTISALRVAKRQSSDGPGGDLESALSTLITTLPKSPVLGDLDVSTGHLAIDVERREATLHVHDLFGRPLAVRYSPYTMPPAGCSMQTQIPLAAVRELAKLIK
jgi:hypothetical protein